MNFEKIPHPVLVLPADVGDVGTPVISPTVGMFAISSTKAAAMRTHYKLAPLRLVERIVRPGGAIGRSGPGAIGRSGPISTTHVCTGGTWADQLRPAHLGIMTERTPPRRLTSKHV